MNSHLLALSVGPVQEFIAAARRTRDLWFGSHLLSEISKAVAKTVRKQGGKLVFPWPDADLTPGSDLNVANVIFAVLEDDLDPQAVAKAAKAAAEAGWRAFADPVFNDLKSVLCPDIWEDQVDDVVEFYAVWVSLDGKYTVARERVMRLLAGRKNCRDFLPAKGRAGVPKSSLDGLRETVLVGPKDGEDPATYRNRWHPSIRRKLRVRSGEQLDVIGVVKRGAGTRLYPSVSRVAADPWLRGLKAEDLGSLRNACEAIPDDALHRLRGERNARYADFPYEGTAVYASRYHEFRDEVGFVKDDENDKRLQNLANALNALVKDKKYGEPNPYLAVLVADGDRMGAAISELADIGTHQDFSKALSQFADKARAIVEEHCGFLVYAGGDDVLAFLPVDKCLSCARKLHDTFGELLKEQSKETKQELTLSVGVAIAHFLDNLEDLLDFGRAAEKHAKNPDSGDTDQSPRNGLAVHLLKRGGSPITVRANWSDDLDGRLAKMAGWLADGKLPTRLANELRGIADAYERWDDGNALVEAIRKDALRVVGRRQPNNAGAIDDIRRMIGERVRNVATLRQFANELLVARQMQTAFRQVKRETAQGDDE